MHPRTMALLAVLALASCEAGRGATNAGTGDTMGGDDTAASCDARTRPLGCELPSVPSPAALHQLSADADDVLVSPCGHVAFREGDTLRLAGPDLGEVRDLGPVTSGATFDRTGTTLAWAAEQDATGTSGRHVLLDLASGATTEVRSNGRGRVGFALVGPETRAWLCDAGRRSGQEPPQGAGVSIRRDDGEWMLVDAAVPDCSSLVAAAEGPILAYCTADAELHVAECAASTTFTPRRQLHLPIGSHGQRDAALPA